MSKKNKTLKQTKQTAKSSLTKIKRAGHDKIAAKKETVLSNKNNRFSLIAIITCAALIVSGGFLYIQHKNKRGEVFNAQFSPDNLVSQITYPVDLFEDGKARHYEYQNEKFTARYFILKSSDGIIRAAFDACDVCWPAGKGYFQSADHMVCRNCGRRFASVLVNEVKGGCNPAPLNRNVKNGNVIIKIDDILDGKQYFNFPGKV